MQMVLLLLLNQKGVSYDILTSNIMPADFSGTSHVVDGRKLDEKLTLDTIQG